MEELTDQCTRLERAAHLLREKGASRRAEAVGIIDDVISELRGHDCNDYADDCDCEPYVVGPDRRGVKGCLAFGLPFIEEKYGLSSTEAREARDIIEGA